MKNITEHLVTKKIQWINAVVLLSCTALSAVTTVIPPIKAWCLANNVYMMVCYVLATSVGLMVFSIFERIRKIEKEIQSDSLIEYISFESVKQQLSSFVNANKIYIYIGIRDNAFFKDLFEYLSTNKILSQKAHVHVVPFIIPDYDEKKFESLNVYLTQSFGETIMFLADGHENKNSIVVLQRKNGSDNSFEGITTKKDSIFTDMYKNIYFNNFDTNRLQIKSMFILQSLECILKHYNNRIDNIFSKKTVRLDSREQFYKQMCEILKNCSESLYAIDFMPPSFWINNYLTRQYGLAHKDVKGSIKKRIHIVDLDNIKKLNAEEKQRHIQDYQKYIVLMAECKVELYFLDYKNYDRQTYKVRGCIVLDEKCVFVAINPMEGIEYGNIDFNIEKINHYLGIFHNYYNIAISSEEFLRILKDEQ